MADRFNIFLYVDMIKLYAKILNFVKSTKFIPLDTTQLTSSSEEESSDDSMNSLLLNFEGEDDGGLEDFDDFDEFDNTSFIGLGFVGVELTASSFCRLLYSTIASLYSSLASAAFFSHSLKKIALSNNCS